MKKESRSTPNQQENQIRIQFIKNLCSKIGEALQDIEDICTEQLETKSKSSSFGQYEGIGLYLYVKENQGAMRTQYPAFTSDQILSILLTKWHQFSQAEKVAYCSKINIKQVQSSKKLKKLDKMAHKLTRSISQAISLCDQDEVNNQSRKQKIDVKEIPDVIQEEQDFPNEVEKKIKDDAVHQSEPSAPVCIQAVQVVNTPQVINTQPCIQMEIQPEAVQKPASQVPVQIEDKPNPVQNKLEQVQLAQVLQECSNQIQNFGGPSQIEQIPVENQSNEKVVEVVQQNQQNDGLASENCLNVPEKNDTFEKNIQEGQSSKEEAVQVILNPSQTQLQVENKPNEPQEIVSLPLISQCSGQNKLENYESLIEEKHSNQEETPVFQMNQQEMENLQTFVEQEQEKADSK